MVVMLAVGCDLVVAAVVVAAVVMVVMVLAVAFVVLQVDSSAS